MSSKRLCRQMEVMQRFFLKSRCKCEPFLTENQMTGSLKL